MNGRYKNLDVLTLPPGPDDARAELVKILDALVEDFRASKIIVFGSCTRGEATRHSDVDLCVIREHPPGCTHPRWEGRMAVARRHPAIGFDLLVLRPDQWEQQQMAPFGVYAEVVQNGLAVYER